MSESKMQFVDANGNQVEEGDPNSAFRINPNDPEGAKIIERLKAGNDMVGQAVHSMKGDTEVKNWAPPQPAGVVAAVEAPSTPEAPKTETKPADAKK